MTNWQSLPSLTALRAFAALAETGSASAAGAQLNVSHAAVSQQVRALEDRIGVALVDRSGRRLALTAEGSELAEALKVGFGTIARTVDALTGADADRPVQVSCTPTFAAQWLMPRLSAFRAAHPSIDLMLSPTPDLVTLEPGGIDIAVRFGRGNWPGLDATLLFEATLVAVTAPGLVAGRHIRDPADLTDLPWVQEYGTTEASDWLRRRGVTKDRAGGLTQMPGNLLLQALREGYGVAVTVKEWIREDLAAGHLVKLFEDADDTGYYIVTRPGALRPKTRAFATWLRQQVRADRGKTSALTEEAPGRAAEKR